MRWIVIAVLGIFLLSGCAVLTQLQKQSSYTARGNYTVDTRGNKEGQLQVEGEFNSPDRLAEPGLLRRGLKKLF